MVFQFEDYAYEVEMANDAVMDFRVVKVLSDDPPELLFVRHDDDGCQDFNCKDFGSADTFMSGHIKWDGCANIDFHTDDIMAHFCGRREATSVGRLLDHLYDVAAAKIQNFDALLGA